MGWRLWMAALAAVAAAGRRRGGNGNGGGGGGFHTIEFHQQRPYKVRDSPGAWPYPGSGTPRFVSTRFLIVFIGDSPQVSVTLCGFDWNILSEWKNKGW